MLQEDTPVSSNVDPNYSEKAEKLPVCFGLHGHTSVPRLEGSASNKRYLPARDLLPRAPVPRHCAKIKAFWPLDRQHCRLEDTFDFAGTGALGTTRVID